MYQKVLVPLDGSELAECVLSHVEALAKGCQIKEVVLLRVCEPPVLLADYPPDMQAEWDEHIRRETAHVQQICRSYLGGRPDTAGESGNRHHHRVRARRCGQEHFGICVRERR